jgi:hypothetical protein
MKTQHFLIVNFGEIMNTTIAENFGEFVESLGQKEELLIILCESGFQNRTNFDNSDIQKNEGYLNFLNNLSSLDNDKLSSLIKEISSISNHADGNSTCVNFDDNSMYRIRNDYARTLAYPLPVYEERGNTLDLRHDLFNYNLFNS